MEELFSTMDYSVDLFIEKIDMGEIGLPEIQRPFVWKDKDVRDLFDSMLRGYPVGCIMLWDCIDPDSKKTIGTEKIKEVSMKNLIIDGQQRLTSLYSVMKKKKVLDSKYNEREIIISFAPLTRKFEVGTAATKNSPEWIYNISDLLICSSSYVSIKEFINNLQKHRGKNGTVLSNEDEMTISRNIEDLFALKNYKFKVFNIKDNANEEDVSQIFVRINSQGKKLTENDFILTLMSVYWNEGRNQIERFCEDSLKPSADRVTSYNSIGLEVKPQPLIRALIAYAFNRGSLDIAYKLLRGADFEHKGVFNNELKNKNFEILKAKLPHILDLNNWHEFLKAVMNSGYLSDQIILSKNAVFYTYAMYLIAKEKFNPSYSTNRDLTSLWFFYAALRVNYSSFSSDTRVDAHFNRIKNFKSFDEYRNFILSTINEAFTDDYFNITLPGAGVGGLAISGAGGNALYAYVASLNVLNRKVLFSKSSLTLSKFFEAGSDGTKKSQEKHHIFPRAYLKKQGYTDTQINQMANYAYIDWDVHSKISDKAPSVYYPEICKDMSMPEIITMEEENALPHGWENMNYEEFLFLRRKLMAKIIKQAFEVLKGKI